MSESTPPSGLHRLPRLPVPAPPPGAYLRRSGRAMFWTIWFQTIAMGLICTGCLVLFHKIVEPQALSQRILPLFANLCGATLLVGIMQMMTRRSWSWPAVGMLIIFLASVGLWLTLKLSGLAVPVQP
jgi:hypothetical protein